MYARDTIIGCDEGLFVEFDFDNDFPAGVNGMKASDDFFAPMPSDCAVGNILYSWNYAYNTDNVNFDGIIQIQWRTSLTQINIRVRSIYSSAMSNLEFALVADGVPASDVYDYMEVMELIEPLISLQIFAQTLTVDAFSGQLVHNHLSS